MASRTSSIAALALVAVFALAFVALATADDLDPVIQQRLDENAKREAQDKVYREGIKNSQAKYVKKMMAKHEEEIQNQEKDDRDDARRDITPEEIERMKASRHWAEKINKDKKLLDIPNTKLKYKIIKSGDGKYLTPAVSRTINYEYRTPEGKVLQSQKNFVTTVNGMRGTAFLAEPLRSMAVGDHWEVYVPYESGFGERGSRGRLVPGYQALIVDIEIVSGPSYSAEPVEEKTDL